MSHTGRRVGHLSRVAAAAILPQLRRYSEKPRNIDANFNEGDGASIRPVLNEATVSARVFHQAQLNLTQINGIWQSPPTITHYRAARWARAARAISRRA